MGKIKVTSHGIIGTESRIFQAWELTTLKGEHASLQRFDGKLYGRIGTNRNENYEEQFEKAYNAILTKHPELINAKNKSDGRIEINTGITY